MSLKFAGFIVFSTSDVLEKFWFSLVVIKLCICISETKFKFKIVHAEFSSRSSFISNKTTNSLWMEKDVVFSLQDNPFK